MPARALTPVLPLRASRSQAGVCARLALVLGFTDTVEPRTSQGHRRVGHLAGWRSRRRQFTEGAVMPHLRGHSTYSVRTVEGWWANVAKGRLTGWTTKPIHQAMRWSG